MSERPWTPGPWTYGVRKNGSIWVSLGDPTNERSAHYQCDFPVREADARLATCAPELYEALDAIVNWRGKRAGLNDGLLPPEQQHADIAEAMRVLAKAKGQE